jgi:hypothetical protein
MAIDRELVGSVAERIAANELEAQGYRVTLLSKGADNADLVAIGKSRVWQIQVKGTGATDQRNWSFHYGHCDQAMIDKKKTVYNSRESGFYRADLVVLVAVVDPRIYSFLALPVDVAERAAQLNLDREYRRNSRKGTPKEPHKMYVFMNPRPREKSDTRLDAERALLQPYQDNWTALEASAEEATDPLSHPDKFRAEFESKFPSD